MLNCSYPALAWTLHYSTVTIFLPLILLLIAVDYPEDRHPPLMSEVGCLRV